MLRHRFYDMHLQQTVVAIAVAVFDKYLFCNCGEKKAGLYASLVLPIVKKPKSFLFYLEE